MPVDAQELRDRLLRTDEEFRTLVAQHRELDTRLNELSSKPYLTESEQVEEVTLKKRKLHLKDRMEAIVRRYRELGTLPALDSAPAPPAR